MKKHSIFCLLPVIVLTGFFSACSAADGAPDTSETQTKPKKTPTPIVENVSLTPGCVALGRGQSLQFQVDTNAGSLAWSVEDYEGAVLKDGTIVTDEGLLTVGGDETAEIFFVYAKPSGAGASDRAVVRVIGNGAGGVAGEGISVSPSRAMLYPGERQGFTATGATGEVSWSVTGSEREYTIADGTLTVAADETAETLTVKASLEGGSCGTANVTVLVDDKGVPIPANNGITVRPLTAAVAKGGTATFTAYNSMGAPISSGISWAVFGAAAQNTTISDGLLTVSGNETAAYLTVKASKDGFYGTAVVTVNSKSASTPGGVNIVDGGNPSIKAKFGVSTERTAAVTETFNKLSAFIQAGGLSNSETSNVIKLGDYIDLEGGLEVQAYNDYGAINIEPGTESGQAGWVITVEDNATYNRGYSGVFLRLIVVGINSFNRVTENSNDTPHVVFQFQNLPGMRRMNPTNDNTGGYQDSEMRKYLTKVDGDTGSGKFLSGLIEAGVPAEAVLWAPVRNVTAGSYDSVWTTATIEDALWLPTAWEIFGSQESSPTETETETNQARLEYYQRNENDTTDTNINAQWRRIKYSSTGSGSVYWNSSPYSGSTTGFCAVYSSGAAVNIYASTVYGFAPAFCVQ